MIKNKKVFRINESEKAEILGMHQQATKRHYLSEAVLMEQPYFLEPSEVFEIQSGLNDYFKSKNVNIKVVADGAWGPKTIEALKKFQEMEGLEADGKMGPNTMAKLKSLGINQNIIEKIGSAIADLFK
jgi:peptidoglycan hydrolase-like protein with peptidoglycan-binding domain